MPRIVFSEGYSEYIQFINEHAASMSDTDYTYLVETIDSLMKLKNNSYPACGTQEIVELNLNDDSKKEFVKIEKQLQEWMKSKVELKYHLARKVSCW